MAQSRRGRQAALVNPSPTWSVIVLAGGTGQRLGGADKAALPIDGTPALERLLASLPDDVSVIVAGPERPVTRPVTFQPESPAGGGPVAGIAAAMHSVKTPNVIIVATDMPWSGPIITALAERFVMAPTDVLIPVSADGRRQVLCCAWSADALRHALDGLGDPHGRSVRDLVSLASAVEWQLDEMQSALLADIDTPDDLTRAQREPPAVP